VNRLSLYFDKPYSLSLKEEPISLPAADEVLVQSIVSAISAGTEMMIYRGQAPCDILLDDTIPAFAADFSFPLKYGYAMVGRVIATGSNIDSAWRGRLVFAFHPHESHFLISPEELIAIPAGISPEEATFLPKLETVINFLMDGQPMIGEQVAVFGQGVVGLLTTALLARLPLASLVTLDRYALRRNLSLELGAESSLDPEAPKAMDQLFSLLQKEDCYTGADLTYELSGSPAALDQAIAVTGFNGRVLIGSWYGQKQSCLNLGGRFHRSRIRLISSQVSTISPEWSGRWTKHRRLQTAWQMLRQLKLSPLISHRFPFTRAIDAYTMLDKKPEESVQILLTYENDR
jgi:2-desacetyl-2-hydroxyethyl bacteriochlorophyllide A dehydrogenase